MTQKIRFYLQFSFGFFFFAATSMAQGSKDGSPLKSADLTKVTEVASDSAQSIWSSLTQVWHLVILTVGDRPIAVSNIVVALIVLCGGVAVSKLLSNYIQKVVLSRVDIHQGAREAIRSLIFYCLILFFFFFALNISNIPLTIFTVVGGAVALGIGFGSQNVMNNFISGLIMLIERPVRIGDVIDVDGTSGVVKVVGARSTIIRSFDNIDIIVPNSSFLEKSVVNWTHGDAVIRTKISVGVVYGSPVPKVIELLTKIANEHPKVLDEPAPSVIFEDFGDNALVFNLLCWLNMTQLDMSRRIRSDIRVRIDELFNENNIVIAFPQRDVHFDAAKPIKIEVLGSKSDLQ